MMPLALDQESSQTPLAQIFGTLCLEIIAAEGRDDLDFPATPFVLGIVLPRVLSVLGKRELAPQLRFLTCYLRANSSPRRT